MSEDAISSRSWFGIRIQDALLILMFGALIVWAHNSLERTYLASLAVLQLVEGRVAWLEQLWGRVTSIVLQLTISWLLMDMTGLLASQYYPILLVPVVSTATHLGVTGTMLTSIAAIGVYLSLLLRGEILDAPPEAIHTLEIRAVTLAISALIVNLLGEARRKEAWRYKRAAEQLATANRNLREAEAAVRRSERLAAPGSFPPDSPTNCAIPSAASAVPPSCSNAPSVAETIPWPANSPESSAKKSTAPTPSSPASSISRALSSRGAR